MNKAYRLMKNGRPIVYEPTHSRAFKTGSLVGYVYEYLVIAEQKIGRPINSTEVVHHIDGDKTNNSPDNLIVLHSNSDHSSLHKNNLSLDDLERLADGSFAVKESSVHQGTFDGHKLKIKDFICVQCGRHFEARPSYRKRKNVFCSRDCLTAYNTTAAMSGMSKDKLELVMKQYKSYVQAANYLGVSDTTVRKYCKRFGIMKPA